MALSRSRENEIIGKIDKLRHEIYDLQTEPTKDAWANYQKIQKKQDEITKLEKELRQDETLSLKTLVEMTEFLGKAPTPKPPVTAHAGLSADQWKEVQKNYRRKQLLKPFKRLIKGYEEDEMPLPKKKCCSNPDVKNEGSTNVNGKKVYEFHCYNCDKTWNEGAK